LKKRKQYQEKEIKKKRTSTVSPPPLVAVNSVSIVSLAARASWTEVLKNQ